MVEPTDFEKALKNQDYITAFTDKRMHIFKEGKVSYVILFIHEDKVYVSSIRQEGVKMIGKVVITNMKLFKRDTQILDRVKITQVRPEYAVGEIVLH